MKKIIIILLIALSTLIYADIIYVPQDFSSIQEAIEYASAGDTIIVSAGIYSENLIINKSLRIQGSTEDTTFVKSHDFYPAQISNTSDVTMENLYFKNFGHSQNPNAFLVDNSMQITFINTGFYGGIGAPGYGGEDGGDGVKVTYSDHITFINSYFIGGQG